MLQIITVLLTALTSGVIAASVTYSLNSRKEQTFFMRKKAEDLYLAAERYTRLLGLIHLHAYAFMRAEVGEKEYYQTMNKSLEGQTGESYENITLIINIYFPQLTNDFEALINVRTKLNSLITRRSHEARRGEYEPQIFTEFDRAFLELTPVSDALKAAIIQQARELNTAQSLWPAGLTWDHWRDRIPPLRRPKI